MEAKKKGKAAVAVEVSVKFHAHDARGKSEKRMEKEKNRRERKSGDFVSAHRGISFLPPPRPLRRMKEEESKKGKKRQEAEKKESDRRCCRNGYHLITHDIHVDIHVYADRLSQYGIEKRNKKRQVVQVYKGEVMESDTEE